MKAERRHQVLVFEDAVGITDGYKGIWNELLARAGINDSHVRVVVRSAYRQFPKNRILEWSKTRKQPGFSTNEQVQWQVRTWVESVVAQHACDLVVCFDPALLFLLNHRWDQATLDRLRGGTYIHLGIPWVVTLPISAFHNKMKAKDIAKLNEGFVEKGDFEEYRASLDEDSDSGDDLDDDESRMEWHEPIIVPYGRFVLDRDFEKVARLLSRIPK